MGTFCDGDRTFPLKLLHVHRLTHLFGQFIYFISLTHLRIWTEYVHHNTLKAQQDAALVSI